MTSEKRNIVLITLDSLRADHCSFMGYHRKTTPTIDKMARKGLYFENAIASGVATPTSMFGVHTGKYSNAVFAVGKLNGNEWRKEIQSTKTLAQVLSDVGYITGAIHANPAVSRFFGFNKGFQYFQDFIRPCSNGKFIRTFDKVNGKLRSNSLMRNIVSILKKEETSTDWNKLIPYITEFVTISKKENRPYFLWVLLLDTHIPYIPPKEIRKWCRLPTIYLIYLNWKIRRNYLNPDRVSDSDKKRIINAYDDCIRYADKFVKTLWNMLKDDDPIFIIHADHGEGFGEHGYFYHPPKLYEELIHVPLVIYNGDVKGKISKPVSLRSIPVTIMDLIKVNDVNNIFSSKNIFNDYGKYVISKVFDGIGWKIAIRSERWKFIMGQSKTDELYDLSNDPREQENLIYAHSDIAEEMRGIVDSHIKREIEKNKLHLRIRKLAKVCKRM